MTKSELQLQTLLHDLEAQGLKPTVTKLKTKRNHKLQLRGRRSTL